MKKLISALLAAVLLISALPIAAFAAEEGEETPMYSDVAGHWAEESIMHMTELGIVNGYPEGAFRPDNPVSRAELAKIIACAFDLEEEELIYDDLEEDAWYYQYLPEAARYVPAWDYWEGGHWFMAPYKTNEQGVHAFIPSYPARRFHIAEGFIKLIYDVYGIEDEETRTVYRHYAEYIREYYENRKIHSADYLFYSDEFFNIIEPELKEMYPNDSFVALADPHGHIVAMQEFGFIWAITKIGVMQGDDGNFNRLGVLTRAEVCTILDRIFTMFGLPEGLKSDGETV